MAAREFKQPIFTALTTDECWTVLSRNHVGRLAFLNDNRVDIEPVHYAATGSWIVIRSADGTKLEALAHTPYVAFEVDEVDAIFDWRSVVARGTIYVMADGERYVDHAMLERALDALRSFVPETLSEGDPTPFRTTVYGLHVDLIVGRRAEQRKRSSKGVPLPTRPRRPKRPRTPDGF